MTAESFVPDDQQDKLAILQDAAQLLGPTLVAARDQAAAQRRRSARRDRDLRQATWSRRRRMAASRRRRSRRRCDAGRWRAAPRRCRRSRTISRRASTRRLDDLRLSLQAEPVTLASLAGRAQARLDHARRPGARRGLPQGRRPRQRCRCAASLPRSATIAPDATGTPVTIQESADTVTHAFAVAGIIALAAISALLLGGAAARCATWLLVLVPLLLAGLLTLGDQRAPRHAAQFREHHHPAAAARHRRRLRHLFRHALARRARATCCNRAPRAPSCSAR